MPTAPTTKDWTTAARQLNEQLPAETQLTTQLLEAIFSDPDLLTEWEGLLSRDESCEAFLARVRDGLERKQLMMSNGTQLAANLSSALWDWMQQGFGIADPERQARRLASCRACPSFSEAPSGSWQGLAVRITGPSPFCLQCGCMLYKKIKMVSSSCPAAHPTAAGLNRWGEPLGV